VRGPLFVPCLALALLVVLAGCIEERKSPWGDYAVNESGWLSLDCPVCTAEETSYSREEGFTFTRVVFHTSEGDVYAFAALPDAPVAGFVLAPGAGVKKEGHRDRAVAFARSNYAFMVLDMRGNGGETGGYPLDLARDYQRYLDHEWPEYYLSICDIRCAGTYLREKARVPVYAMGESNGGRYAAIAAALDPAFAGFIGVSTSGFRRAGDSYAGDARRFLLSVDPEACAGGMAPRTSWVLHSPGDPVIPFADGQAFYRALPEPKSFFPFNGTHGLNEEADARILGECAQIYGPAG